MNTYFERHACWYYGGPSLSVKNIHCISYGVCFLIQVKLFLIPFSFACMKKVSFKNAFKFASLLFSISKENQFPSSFDFTFLIFEQRPSAINLVIRVFRKRLYMCLLVCSSHCSYKWLFGYQLKYIS